MDLQPVQNKIYEIRGCRVMLDFDLAELYEVETRVLNQAVKRNPKRFPPDFMFQLNQKEWERMSSQFVMTSRVKRPKSAYPLAFTEHGATMLSSVLRSDVAIEASILVVRAFVAVRQFALEYSELNKKLEAFMIDTNMKFNEVYKALTVLAGQQPPPMPEIGYTAERYREKE